MPRLLSPPIVAAPVEHPRIRWNIAQYESLFSMGLLEHGKYELLDGDVVSKMPIKYSHGFIQATLLFLLARLFGQDRIVPPVSVRMDDASLPEPDVVVVKEPRTEYVEKRFLSASDVLLIAEVSDATIDDDLTRKAGIYARSGIAEYWVLDVSGRRLLIHGSPTETGYTHIVQYDEADTAAPLALPAATFLVSELLP